MTETTLETNNVGGDQGEQSHKYGPHREADFKEEHIYVLHSMTRQEWNWKRICGLLYFLSPSSSHHLPLAEQGIDPVEGTISVISYSQQLPRLVYGINGLMHVKSCIKSLSEERKKNQNVFMGEASRIELLGHEGIGRKEIVILGDCSTLGPLFHHSACFQYRFPCYPHTLSWCDRLHIECSEFLPQHPTISKIITHHDFYFSRGQSSCLWKR